LEDKSGGGCTDLSSEFIISNNTDNIVLRPIILVEKGICSISTKVSNVEKVHGLFALIINDSNDSIDIHIENNNPFQNIHIPGFLISLNDGLLLKRYFVERVKEKGHSDILTIQFDSIKKVYGLELETIDLYFTSIEEKMYKFLMDFAKYYQELSNKLITLYTY